MKKKNNKNEMKAFLVIMETTLLDFPGINKPLQEPSLISAGETPKEDSICDDCHKSIDSVWYFCDADSNHLNLCLDCYNKRVKAIKVVKKHKKARGKKHEKDKETKRQ